MVAILLPLRPTLAVLRYLSVSGSPTSSTALQKATFLSVFR